MRQSLKDDIQSMLDMEVIRESTSPYSAPVVIVRGTGATVFVLTIVTSTR